MIHKYTGQNFIGFRKNILKYIEINYNELSQSVTSKKLTNTLKTILDEQSLTTLYELDQYSLKFHNWSIFNDALNDSTLGRSNNLLYAFSETHTTQIVGEPINVIESLFLVLYADIYEASLIINNPVIRFNLEKMVSELQSFSSSLSSENFYRLTQIWFIVPREVFTKHLDQHLDPEVIKTVATLKSNEDFIAKKLNSNELLKQDIEEIQKSLEEQKSEYNFVGLSNGFRTLREQKKKELNSQGYIYYGLMTVIVLLIALKSVWSAYYLSSNSFENPIFIIVTISTILFLFILLYFFKISLVNVRSIKSQILQIDLRLTLCQFIHNYDSDTKGLREGMKESFERFESVIFAPIVATEDQMPATFDGIEQITNLLGSITNKGK